MAHLASIYRYPVKGLSGKNLHETLLSKGKGVLHDRQFALALGDTEFDPLTPDYLPKKNFLMQFMHEELAALASDYDEVKNTLTLMHNGSVVYSGHLASEADKKALGLFFDGFLPGKTRGGAHLVTAEGHMFADIPDQNLSLINFGSILDVQDKSGIPPIDPRRFRGNLYIKDMEPWAEFDLIGKEFRIGEAVFKGTERIRRCANVNVNPDTAKKDMNIPLALKKIYGHTQMGIYADVIEGGMIRDGDSLTSVS